MIKNIIELNLDDNDEIVIFSKELLLYVSNITEIGWNKKFVIMSNDIDSQNTNRINEFIVNDKLNYIIKKVIENMNKYDDYKINKINFEEICVELHYANSNNYYIRPWSHIHRDNDNGCLVNTFICYFDVNCEGGDFAIYDLDNKTILSSINVSSSINNKKAIIFSGDLLHNPLQIRNGHRYALSFQIPIY
jgi:hypothetical protein